MSVQDKYLSYLGGIAEMVRAVTGGGAFSNSEHLRILSEERRERKKDRDVAYESELKGLLRDLKGTEKSLLLSSKRTGAWLRVRVTTVSGTLISAKKFWAF